MMLSEFNDTDCPLKSLADSPSIYHPFLANNPNTIRTFVHGRNEHRFGLHRNGLRRSIADQMIPVLLAGTLR